MFSPSSRPMNATVVTFCPHGSARMSPPSGDFQCSVCGFEVKITELAKPEWQKPTGPTPKSSPTPKDSLSTPGSAGHRAAYGTPMSLLSFDEVESLLASSATSQAGLIPAISHGPTKGCPEDTPSTTTHGGATFSKLVYRGD